MYSRKSHKRQCISASGNKVDTEGILCLSQRFHGNIRDGDEDFVFLEVEVVQIVLIKEGWSTRSSLCF